MVVGANQWFFVFLNQKHFNQKVIDFATFS